MNEPIKTFTVVDARTLDGDCYEVAEAAVTQAVALADLAAEYTAIAQRMARNAHDERVLYLNGEIKPPFHLTAEHRNFAATIDKLSDAVVGLRTLAKSVAWNPRAKVVKG
jgi:adenosine deaminase